MGRPMIANVILNVLKVNVLTKFLYPQTQLRSKKFLKNMALRYHL